MFKFKLHNLTLALMAFYILSTSFVTGYTWAQGWVDHKMLYASGLKAKVRKQLKEHTLQLVVLTRKELVITPSHGKAYLQCYLINNTDTTSIIQRADATITGFCSQIYKEGRWQPFQKAFTSDCGNSYWKQELPSHQALSIQYDHDENGPIRIPFRIAYNHGQQVSYSNIIEVNIDQENYNRVGKGKLVE